jgi:ubiquinone/menaquinone biosynthesis C-methylase UbiE
MGRNVAELRKHRGDYGFDGAHTTVAVLSAIGAAGLFFAGLAFIRARSRRILSAVLDLLVGLLMLQALPSYLYSTRRGKFAVWAELLDGLQLRGDERVLDLGCGLGATLSIVAKAVPSGRAVGLDLWRSQDQSGNSLETAWRNLDIEGVRERCEIRTGDMRAVPFPDSTFDLVVSSLAIHNIKGHAERLKAIDEAIRVLKPGGRLLIADILQTRTYARRLRERGMEDVVEKQLDWRFWYGALGTVTGLVTATKPTDPGGVPPLLDAAAPHDLSNPGSRV